MTVTVEVKPNTYADRLSSTAIDEKFISMEKIIESPSSEQLRLLTPNISELSDSADNGNFFDLRPPPPPAENQESKVEEVMNRLYSEEHLNYILNDRAHFQRFLSFLNRYRPNLAPTLIRYVEMRKAMKAIEYANTVARTIKWPTHADFCKFSRIEAAQTDVRFVDYASREVNILISEALPLWVTYLLVSVVTDCVTRDITGQSLPVVKELVGNLGEIFCLTDPTQKDNPIIFCSEEFYRTTQYGTNFAINRNCRFLQGPHTDEKSTTRLAKAITNGQETSELLLNYRRDGSPFVNLLMVSPLYDDKGVVRYYIGAQIDVTGLVLDGLGLDSFRGMLQKHRQQNSESEIQARSNDRVSNIYSNNNQDRFNETLAKFTELSLLLTPDESEIIMRNPHNELPPPPDNDSVISDGCSIRSMLPSNKVPRPIRRIIDAQDSDTNIPNVGLQRNSQISNRSLAGVYRHYLLIRPYPSLQIIFASPSLRLPGLLRTPLFTKIGGPPSVLSSLEDAFRDGASVTARILWLPKHGHPPTSRARRRWIRCTPLLGSDERVGVWMVLLVPSDGDDDNNRSMSDSGYHSLGGAGNLLGINVSGDSRQSQYEHDFGDCDDLAAIESLVGGRRNSGVESIGTSSRLRRVTILDHESDSINQSECNSTLGLNAERSIHSLSKRGTEESTYGQLIGNMASSTSIIEEEV
ncbi:hypothetical protein GcM1_198041 [Golovinomyces cichoracearum]|uniref:PAC domain-containing protein n=1 Tax=Golovinomyces cichoracearum TaxID=62708 RepID=A0A420IZK7_9PEZI|nr:hypothetical protein GcM1_198041 [Golovinomyces cichoracearum]